MLRWLSIFLLVFGSSVAAAQPVSFRGVAVGSIAAGPELAAHRHSPYPALSDERVRYVGQPIAACLKPTRAQAEDLADQVEVELEALPAVTDAVAALRPGSPKGFDHWPDNAYIASAVNEGDPAGLGTAPS